MKPEYAAPSARGADDTELAMKTFSLSTLGTLAMALALAACKSDAPKGEPAANAAKDAAPAGPRAGVVASCEMMAAVGSCTEWAKLSMGLEKGLCQGLKGNFAEGAAAGCPAANEIGRCAMADGETKHYYGTTASPTGYTLADAERDCQSPELGGKFSKTLP